MTTAGKLVVLKQTQVPMTVPKDLARNNQLQVEMQEVQQEEMQEVHRVERQVEIQMETTEETIETIIMTIRLRNQKLTMRKFSNHRHNQNPRNTMKSWMVWRLIRQSFEPSLMLQLNI